MRGAGGTQCSILHMLLLLVVVVVVGDGEEQRGEGDLRGRPEQRHVPPQRHAHPHLRRARRTRHLVGPLAAIAPDDPFALAEVEQLAACAQPAPPSSDPPPSEPSEADEEEVKELLVVKNENPPSVEWWEKPRE